ncbi:MAG: HAD family phosphatase [Terrimicrobiaceae bacterium]
MNSQPIDCIIFDIGNVLFPFDYERAGHRLAGSYTVNRELVVEAKADLESGRIQRAEFLARVRPEFEFAGTDEEFLAIWSDIFDHNHAMENLVRRLARTHPLFLLSNISCIHRHFLHENYEFLSLFRDGIYSYEVGLLKPDPAIFRLARDRFAPVPSRAIYIDDMPENVAAALAEGFIAIQYDFRNHLPTESRILEILKTGASD